jgi:TolB-like protein/class 3 adenylate cyclase
MNRRLAAILATDVAGYSRLMHEDEEDTHARFTALIVGVIEPAIVQHGGRIVKSTGDGFLAEFPSAVEAAKCALQFQAEVALRSSREAEDRRLKFRAGIHLGDVIVEERDIYGDGVNVAARLEALAEPGGIAVSGVVHENVRGRVSCSFEDLGDQTVKNIANPVRIYRVLPMAEQPHAEPKQSLALPDKPSIAVLPFENMSGDPTQEYFVDGMTEELITALSRVPSFFVVARNSTFAYKGTSPDIRRVGRDLGVRYVLEGGVRKADDRVRITSRLTDAVTGIHVWAARFDGVLTDIFELQDQVAASVVGTIEPKLRQLEMERARHKSSENLQAYDLVLRSRFAYAQLTDQAFDEACSLLHKALVADPSYALALALLSLFHLRRAAQYLTMPSEAELDKYVRMADEAVRLAPDEPEVLVPAAYVIGLPGGKLEGAITLVQQALAVNANSAEAWAASGVLRAYSGETKIALDHLDRSKRLSPLYVQSSFQHFGFALAHFVDGDYERAVTWTEAGSRQEPNEIVHLRYRSAALGLLGRLEEAQQARSRLLELNPCVTVSRVRRHVEVELKNPYKKPGVADALYEGLRLAGLPE